MIGSTRAAPGHRPPPGRRGNPQYVKPTNTPRAIGGTWKISNLRLAHKKCNNGQWSIKGMHPDALKAAMRSTLSPTPPEPFDILEGFDDEPRAPRSRPGFKMGSGTPHLHVCRWCPGLHSCVSPNCSNASQIDSPPPHGTTPEDSEPNPPE